MKKSDHTGRNFEFIITIIFLKVHNTIILLSLISSQNYIFTNKFFKHWLVVSR